MSDPRRPIKSRNLQTVPRLLRDSVSSLARKVHQGRASSDERAEYEDRTGIPAVRMEWDPGVMSEIEDSELRWILMRLDETIAELAEYVRADVAEKMEKKFQDVCSKDT